jgi:hypothetical protein
MTLLQTGHNKCFDRSRKDYGKKRQKKSYQKPNECQTYKTWNRIEVEFRGVEKEEEEKPFLPNGTLIVEDFHQVMNHNEKGRGEHGGRFEYRTRSGILMEGKMIGVSQAGTHREPSAWDLESADEFGHLEGRLVGTILNGSQKGVLVEARYVIETDEKRDKEYRERTRKQPGAWRRKQIVMNLDGWGIIGCLESPLGKERTKPTIIWADEKPSLKRIPVKKVDPLPDKYFRSIEEIPKDVVEQFRKAEGGLLTSEGESRLRMMDRQFTNWDKSQDGFLSFEEFQSQNKPSALSLVN